MDPKNSTAEQMNDEASVTMAEDMVPAIEGALALDSKPEDAAVTREQRRSRRKRDVRAKTISVKRMTKRELELGRMLYPDVEDVQKPRTREECTNGERPCAFVSCKHHLYLDVSARTGAIMMNGPSIAWSTFALPGSLWKWNTIGRRIGAPVREASSKSEYRYGSRR